MIGFFVFDCIPSVDEPLVLAHSALNTEIKGLFYVRESDCKDISEVQKGAEFFGVLDDSSGFGSCLFIKGLNIESNAMLLQNNLHIKGNTAVDGNLKVNGQITGKSSVTILKLTSDDIVTLAKSITSQPGTLTPVTLSNVTVEMQNG